MNGINHSLGTSIYGTRIAETGGVWGCLITLSGKMGVSYRATTQNPNGGFVIFFTRLEILQILPCSPDPITMRIGQLKLAVCLPLKTEKPP